MSTLPNTFEAVDEDVERIRERPWESPPTSSVFGVPERVSQGSDTVLITPAYSLEVGR
nr:hypothetical protein [Haloferax larsenii]